MEHPILLISLVFEALGLPVPHGAVGNGLIEQLCAPYMTYTWFVMAFLVFVVKVTLGELELIPGNGQNFWELIIGGLDDFFVDNIGRELTERYFPMIATFALFIAVANLIGLVPGFMSPTASINTTLALTLIVWVTHHFIGIKIHGWGYFNHFTGPKFTGAMKLMVFFMLPIELVSNLARILSLSVRLFGNIVAKEILLGVLFMLAGGFFAPLPILLLGVLVSLVQTLVFVLLTLIYFNQAASHAH